MVATVVMAMGMGMAMGTATITAVTPRSVATHATTRKRIANMIMENIEHHQQEFKGQLLKPYSIAKVDLRSTGAIRMVYPCKNFLT